MIDFGITPDKIAENELALYPFPCVKRVEIPFAAYTAKRTLPQLKKVRKKFIAVTTMNPKYREYKDSLSRFLLDQDIDPDVHWCKIIVFSCVKYASNTPRKFQMPYRLSGGMAGDWDNFGKPVCDALQDAKLIKNDSQIFDGRVVTFRSLLGSHQIIYLYGDDNKDSSRIYRI